VASDYVQQMRHNASDLNEACDRLLDIAMEKASARGYSSTHFCFQLRAD